MEVGGGGGAVPGGRMGERGGAGDWKGRGKLTYGESARRSNPDPSPDPNPKSNEGATVVAYLLLDARG